MSNSTIVVRVFSYASRCPLQAERRVTEQALADAAYLSGRPLPNAPDGRYDSQVKPASDPADTNANHSALYKLVTDVEQRIKKGPLIKDPKIIVSNDPLTRQNSSFNLHTCFQPAVLDLLTSGGVIDDRKGLVSDLIDARDVIVLIEFICSSRWVFPFCVNFHRIQRFQRN